jgi:hypothetical protein
VLMLKEKRPAFRTIEGWAISILLEAGAICECEEHGWMKDRTDPQARAVGHRDRPPVSAALRRRVETDRLCVKQRGAEHVGISTANAAHSRGPTDIFY